MDTADLHPLIREDEEHRQLQKDREEPSLGGSTAAVILMEAAGEKPPFGRSAFDEWARLMKLRDENPDTDRFEMGRDMESVVATRFTRKTGLTTEKIPLLVHPKYPWYTGHLDRVTRERPGDLELKTVEWMRDAFEWSDPDAGEPNRVPMLYFLQACWYAGLPREGVGAFERDFFIAMQLGLSKPVRVYRWAAGDPTIVAVGLRALEICHEWWERHVVKRDPPPAPSWNPDAGKRRLAYQYPMPKGQEMREGDARVVELARAYEEARRKEKAAAKEKAQLAVQIGNLVGDSYGLIARAGEVEARITYPLIPEQHKSFTQKPYRCLKVNLKGDDTPTAGNEE